MLTEYSSVGVREPEVKSVDQSKTFNQLPINSQKWLACNFSL